MWNKRHAARRIAALALAILSGATSAAGQAPREPWNIEATTSRVIRGEDGGRVLMFEEDVVITHGELVATSERAEYLEDLRRALLTGNVVLTQDSTIVRAPVCFYDRDTRVARFPSGLVVERATGTAVADQGAWRRDERKFELKGRVAAADTSGTLDADAVTYDTAAEIFWAAGAARLVDIASGVVVEGPALRYERRASAATATGRPKATFDDQDVPVEVVSEEMRYDPEKNVGTAIGNVVLTRETMEATGGLVRFYRDENRVVLEESPRVVDGTSEITGDSIELITVSSDHRTARVRGSARVEHKFGAETGSAAPVDSVVGQALQETLAGARDAVVEREQEILAAVPDSVPPRENLEALMAAAGIDSTVSPRAIVEESLASVREAAAADSAVAADSTAAADSIAAADSNAATDSTAAEKPEWLRIPGDQLPKHNLLLGEEIAIDVVNDELRKVEVFGHGRSKFYPNDEAGDLTEWNDVVGDTLHVWFTESKVDSVTVLGHGVGEYRLPAGEEAGAAPDVLRSKGKLVEYRAPEIRYDRGNKLMHLARGSEVKYKTMTLRSGTIDFDSAKEVMIAGGEPKPILVDTDEEISGDQMRYHMPTEQGEIIGGRTKFENAFYHGKDIWKLGDDVLAVEDAAFSTCELEKPHYHFSSSQMKIYMDDKIVAKPVVLKIRNIPVFALPFYVASLKKHRHSGFLLPNFELGVDDNRGRFLRNLGYYWAPNDYLDATASFDFYPAQDRVVSYLTSRYNVRYRFDGRLAIKYNRDVPRDKKDTVVEASHRQTLSETADLTGDARFFSSSSIYQDIDDAQRLDRDIRSNLTFSKRFPGSNRSFRVDLQRQENLDDGSLVELLPAVVFSQPSRPLVGSAGARGGIGGDTADRSSRGVLEDLYWNLESQAARVRTRSAIGTEEEHSGSQARSGLRMTRNVLKHLRFSPSVDGEATWIDEDRRGDSNALRATYRTSVAASTTIYGTMLKPLGPARGFRHLIEPGASWNWAPEFREYLFVAEGDTTRTLQDRFFSFGGIGGTPRKSNNMSFSIRNLLQTKWRAGENETRIDLFTLRNAISYDFLAEDLGRKPLSNFSSSLNILSSLPVNQSWTVTHDPYSWDLLGSSVTTRARLSSRMFSRGGSAGGDALADEVATNEPPNPIDATPAGAGAVGETPVATSRSAGAWSLDVSHTAQRNATGNTSSGVVLNSSWSPTEKWSLTYSTQYDLRNGDNTAQSWSVLRKIHCWELSFDRRLLGGEWQYYLRVNVTDLPDIQAERGDRFRGRGAGSALDDIF